MAALAKRFSSKLHYNLHFSFANLVFFVIQVLILEQVAHFSFFLLHASSFYCVLIILSFFEVICKLSRFQ